jgi:adenylate cyclase
MRSRSTRTTPSPTLGLACATRFVSRAAVLTRPTRAPRFATLRIATASGTDDATALAVAGFLIHHLDHDYAGAVSAIERALSSNPSCATALYFGAHVHAYNGNAHLARSYANRALRLSPFDLTVHEGHMALALAAIQEARYDDAVPELAKMVQANSAFSSLHFLHAVGLALAGRLVEARPIVARGLVLEPTYRIRMFGQIGLTPLLADRLAEGARLLGLPE